MTTAQTSEDAAILISVIALGIALLAALFTAWQGWTAHKTRQDSLRVDLSIVHVDRSDGSSPRSSWMIRNNGRGEVLDPTVVIIFSFEKNRHIYEGRLDGVLHGFARELLTFDRPPARPDTTLEGHPEVRVGDYLRATVSYSRPGRACRRKSRIAIVPSRAS